MRIEKPLVVMFESGDGNIQCHLYPEGRGYEQYGILVADLVRHIANAFKVHENDVWEWVDKERDRPTSPATEIKIN